MRKIGEKNLSTELRICKGIRKAVLSAAMLSLLALTACSTGKAKTADSPVPGGDEQGGEIFIAAAASLKPVMEEVLIPGFTKSHPVFTVTGTYDSSGKLQKQIEEGLEADLFLSAATKQMDALNEKGLLDSASVTMLLENQIVLIVPEGSEDSYGSFTDIEKAAVIAIGDPDSVPAGQYAKEALTQTGLWDSLNTKLSLGTNVTEVLNWVAEGSADAGIVYATDAATTQRVKVIAPAPEGSLSERVLYPAAILSGSGSRDGAELFLAYLKSSEAKDAFSSYGLPAAGITEHKYHSVNVFNRRLYGFLTCNYFAENGSLRAAHCLSRRNPARLAGYEYSKTAAENRNGQSSDITVSSAPYSGRPFIALSLWREPSAGAIFSRCIRRENCLFLCLHGDCLGLCLLPHDVPLCPRRF